MSVASSAQLGFKKEAAFDTPLVVDRFFEFEKEGIAGVYNRIESTALRSGSRLQRADRFAPNPKGAAGTIPLEVLSKGYGFWLEHMVGTVAQGSANTDGFITFTGTFGDFRGKSLCAQVGRPDNQETIEPFVYSGGKVAAWELANAVDGLLMLNLDLDFAHEYLPGDTAAGSAGTLATPSYPSGSELMSYIGASFQIGGVELAVTDISIKGDNALSKDRYFIRANGDKKEQVGAAMRNYTWDATIEFESTAQISRVASLTAAGAVASISTSWRSPTKTGNTYPSLTVTVPAARWDQPLPNVDGPQILTHKIGGKILDPTTGASPVTIAYVSTDTTP